MDSAEKANMMRVLRALREEVRAHAANLADPETAGDPFRKGWHTGSQLACSRAFTLILDHFPEVEF